MATNEEILDIILAIQAQGAAGPDAVNQILSRTGNTAATTAGQVQVLTAAHEQERQAVLQTLDTHATYGETLTAQEARYANLQLASEKATKAEHDLASEGRAAALAMGSLGETGARSFDRLAALSGLAAGGGFMGVGTAAALVGVGAVIEGGKSMIENADRNEEAQRNLSSAFQDQGKSLENHQAEIDAFLNSNRRLISDQYEAKDSIASIVRAGFDWTQAQRLMNDALDLSAAKHVSLTDATKDLIDAEQGRSLGLIDLGINVKNIENPEKEVAKAQKEVETATAQHTRAVRELLIWEDNHHDRSVLTAADLLHEQGLKDAASSSTTKLKDANNDLATAEQLAHDKGSQFNQILDQVEGKVKGDRGDVSNLTQSFDDLKTSWDGLSNTYGPGLEEELAKLIDYINHHGIPAIEQLNAGFDQLNSAVVYQQGNPNSPVNTDPFYINEINSAQEAITAWEFAHGISGPPPAPANQPGAQQKADDAADKKAELALLKQIALNTRYQKGDTIYIGLGSAPDARTAGQIARELG